NQQEQNQELTALLEERKKEAGELANLARNKDEVVKNLERRLLDAKKVIAELRAEVIIILIGTASDKEGLYIIDHRYRQMVSCYTTDNKNCIKVPIRETYFADHKLVCPPIDNFSLT
ncbi:hypothetical protein pdam_00000418, partial [Pocillopora damicornis]